MSESNKNDEDTKQLVQLVCKIERTVQLHTIDGLIDPKNEWGEKYKNVQQYTCLSCGGSYYYKIGEEPTVKQHGTNNG